jgi:hypothetical protein
MLKHILLTLIQSIETLMEVSCFPARFNSFYNLIFFLAIRLQDLEKWLQEKAANEGGGWKYFVHNPQIYMMAHEHASKYINANSKLFLIKKKIVDLQQFRALLVQLFAISVLWVHFKKADEFIMGNDAYNSLLNRIEFKLGVKSFCAAYGHEDLTEEQLDADFDTLDKDRSGNISFNEVKSIFSPII